MKLSLFSFLLICYTFIYSSSVDTSYNNQLKDNIFIAIKKGSSKSLARYFNENVELLILDKEDIYSKAQAELILKDFFIKNKILKFKLIYKSQRKKANYSIGELTTSMGNFRIYFLLKKGKIYQLRIEKKI